MRKFLVILVYFVLNTILLPFAYSSDIATFKILSGNLIMHVDPNDNTFIDILGVHGIQGKSLKVERFNFAVNDLGGAGKLNFKTGLLEFAVNWDVNYEIFDSITNQSLGDFYFPVLFKEKGTYDETLGEAFLKGEGKVGAISARSFGEAALRELFITLLVGPGLYGLKRVCDAEPIEIQYKGGFPKGTMEFQADFAPESNEGKVNGTVLGEMSLVCDKLLVKLQKFEVIAEKNKAHLAWTTVENNNAGFHIWRGIKGNTNNYKLTLLKEYDYSEQIDPDPNEDCSTKIQGQLNADNSSQPSKLISAMGNSAESTCYSFTDTSNLSNGTYYYLLEDIDDNGDSTFHCDQIDAVTIGQGPAIDLESAINYCKEETGSNN